MHLITTIAQSTTTTRIPAKTATGISGVLDIHRMRDYHPHRGRMSRGLGVVSHSGKNGN